MKNIIITTAILAAMTTGQALAGNFGSAGSGPDGTGAKADVEAAGAQAFAEAKKAGSSDARAESLRDAATAEAEATRQNEITNERNGNVGTWINDN